MQQLSVTGWRVKAGGAYPLPYTVDHLSPRAQVERAFSTQSLASLSLGAAATPTPYAGAAVGYGGQAANTLVSGSGSMASLVMSAPAIAGAVVSGAAASGAAWATAAIPVVGPIIAGVTVALQLLFSRKGPKQKVATTKIVDQVEPLMKENLDGYMAGPRTKTAQAQALANFDAGWQWVVENCQTPVMGDPGQWCVTDRQRGGKWDWFSYYRNPIANDPQVKADDPALFTTDPETGKLVAVNGQPVGVAGGLNLNIVILAAAVGLGLLLMD